MSNIASPTRFTSSQWWAITKRTADGIQSHNTSLISAGVAFYFLLAIFPLIAAFVSIYGLIVDKEQLQAHLQTLITTFPADSRAVFEAQMSSLIGQSNQALGTGFFISLMLTIWSGGKGAQAIITATNISYREDEQRGFLQAAIAKVLLTLAIIISIIFTLGLITVVPETLSFVSGYELSKGQANWITWPLLIILFNLGLAALYRFSPNRSSPKWRWVTPGSIFASSSWFIASFAFAVYVEKYASYNETYGSVGGIIILLMWFYLTAFIILIGAEINAACELQTGEDSTVGNAQPLGDRGADVADKTV